MIDLGVSKLALIAVVALVVVGPERLPKVALRSTRQMQILAIKPISLRIISREHLSMKKKCYASLYAKGVKVGV